MATKNGVVESLARDLEPVYQTLPTGAAPKTASLRGMKFWVYTSKPSRTILNTSSGVAVGEALIDGSYGETVGDM